MSDQKRSVKDFFSYIKAGLPAKWLVAVALVLSLLETAASLIVPLFARDLVDQLAGGGLSKGLIVFLAVTFLVQTVSGGFSYYILAYIGEHIVAHIRRQLWNHILRLPVRYFDEHESGETMSRITQDTTMVKNLITNHLVSFVTGVITIIGAVVILLTIDWRMTVIMLLSVPVALFVLMPLGRIMYRVSRRLQDEMADFSANLGRVLSEIRLVKASNAEAAESRKGAHGIGQLFTYGLKEARIQAIISPFVTTIIMVVLVVLIGYGGVRVASGALSAGSLVAVIIYVFQIIVPFSQMATFFTAFQKAMGATERIQFLHKIDVEKEAGDRMIEVDKLAFHDVSFGYAGSERVILKGVSFAVLPGETVALVGPSGAGKTTVFSLIERFYSPAEGEIVVGDVPLESIELEEWRRSIGYVSQDSPVMSGTIRDNICYGLKGEVSDFQIGAALQQANAIDFVADLEEGIHTRVGERGVKLSGGQRQRIAIARALLRDPDVLLLDEATSNLDSESEAAVQEALRTLMEGRTTLVIAHRLSTVVDADQLLMLEDGMITGRGRHAELYEGNARYRELVDQQML
ncbi:multidrug ABC transporter permease [Halobacillus andaensis]|uniref:Multidrug ABC transporter permease n=1 Tax=Halobacillus andaensis TaxID=1176239 RepID=A0A917B558_HALAA|nr:ABC transporter ATP-binding protein [Halobacillus andaensis]MBP2004318.1 ATP-binding cassette subfamily B protein AbcA/BmrA [Halobacillus andaensis]GGF22552.1 multidrug ABC transporter permease [Halobacillus andaensis]